MSSKLSALSSMSTLDGSELIYGSQGGTSKKTTTAQLRSSTFVAPTFTANAYTTVLADLQTVLGVDASGAEKTVTLLSAATAGTDAIQTIVKTDSSTLRVIVKNPSAVIIGVLTAKGQSMSFRSDGSNWMRLGIDGYKTPFYEVDRDYPPIPYPSTYSTFNTPVQDKLYFCLIVVRDQAKIDALLYNRVNAATGTIKCKLALYGLNSANWYKPDGGSLLAQSSAEITQSTGGGGVDTSTLDSTVLVDQGAVWAAVMFGGGGTTVAQTLSMNQPVSGLFGGAAVAEAVGSSTATGKGWTAANTYNNGFPSTAPACTICTGTTADPAIPAIGWRAA